jgi:hypothetical protein
MAVPEQTPIKAHTGNGVTTVFAYDFLVLDEDDMLVLVDGSEVSAALWSVSGIGVDTGGSVTFTTAPANAARVVILRDSVVTRATDYQNNGDLLAAVINRDFDRLWLVLQEVINGSKGSTRTVRAPSGETLSELPAAASRASMLLGFDSSGNPSLVAPASGTAADVATNLANTADVAKGDALVGEKRTVTGAVATTAHASNELRKFDVARDFGVTASNSQAEVRAALQLAITAAGALSNGGTVEVPAFLNYGLIVTDKTTWPSFSGVAVPVTVIDYSEGASYGTHPTTYDGAQVRYWLHTPQTTVPGTHDGNTFWLRGAWAPNYCISNDMDLTGARLSSDNRRASFTLFTNGEATYRFGQGANASATLTNEELADFIAEKYAATGDTIASVWAMFRGERKTHRMSYGLGASNPLAAHDFGPGNSSETLDVALFRTAAATSTVSVQSSAGVNARSFFRNNAGVTEIGAQTGGVAIKIKQADSFAEFGTGSSYTYHHNIQAARDTNWISFVNNTSATDGFVQRLQSTSTQAATWNFLGCYANAGADLRFVVAGTGNLTNANNSYGAISDARLKQDITDAGSAWSDVKAYRFRKFRFKSDPTGPLQLGVIAQELAEVSPGLVEEVPDYNDPNAERMLTVKYSVLLLKAAVALQEAMRRIEALEAKVNT